MILSFPQVMCRFAAYARLKRWIPPRKKYVIFHPAACIASLPHASKPAQKDAFGKMSSALQNMIIQPASAAANALRPVLLTPRFSRAAKIKWKSAMAAKSVSNAASNPPACESARPKHLNACRRNDLLISLSFSVASIIFIF